MELIDVVSAKELEQFSHEEFIGFVNKIPLETKNVVYQYMVYVAFCKIRNYDETLTPRDIEDVADRFHNLPLFLMKNLEGFQDEVFWKFCPRDNKNLLHRLKLEFIQELKRFY